MDYVYIFLASGSNNSQSRSIVYKDGVWALNIEHDGGEFVEMLPPPKEVIDYFKSLLSQGDSNGVTTKRLAE